MTGTTDTSIAALIWCPFPDQEKAADAVHTLLDERLVACANMITNMISLFEWNGERDEARETGVLLKTNAAKLDRAIARLAALHPYDEPAIVGWRCDAAAPGTAAWLGALGQ
jgi:periplasmic divalent cation tolerance protein